MRESRTYALGLGACDERTSLPLLECCAFITLLGGAAALPIAARRATACVLPSLVDSLPGEKSTGAGFGGGSSGGRYSALDGSRQEFSIDYRFAVGSGSFKSMRQTWLAYSHAFLALCLWRCPVSNYDTTRSSLLLHLCWRLCLTASAARRQHDRVYFLRRRRSEWVQLSVIAPDHEDAAISTPSRSPTHHSIVCEIEGSIVGRAGPLLRSRQYGR